MSRELYKPVPCKQGCGKDVVWERDNNGKWLPPFEFDVQDWVKLERHMCPNYKPQQNKPFEKRGEGTNWAGTNKQGQMFEARENNEQQIDITKLDLLLTKVNDMVKLQTQILLLLKPVQLTDEEIKEISGREKIDEPQKSTTTEQKQEDEYGF